MDKKNNMKQAMYEMFGVGTAPVAKAGSPAKKEEVAVEMKPMPKEADKNPTPPAKTEREKTPVIQKPVQTQTAASYLAPGTVMEGTLHTAGDVEIAGEFKGDITAKGTVLLRSGMQGNITADTLKLFGCNVTGDVVVRETVCVSQGSAIRGNVTAREVQCAGQITGDLKVSENTDLESTAQINGGIITGTISVAKGAMIKGAIEIKAFGGSDKDAGTVQVEKKGS